MMTKIRFFALVFGLLLSTIGYSQIDNSFFSRRDSSAYTSTDKWQLQLDQLGFVRNSEYRTRIIPGKTLFGYQTEANVKYKINDYAYIKAGLWLKRDFGGEGFHQIDPLFSFHIKKKNTEFIFGNLLGTTDHNLVEPLLDPEKIITDRIENGLQLIHEGKKWKLDFWIDWQKMIYQNSPFQEQFVAGYSSSLELLANENIALIAFAQASAFHKGGEIDATLSRNVSMYNFNNGFKFEISPNVKAISLIELRADFCLYEDESTFVEDTYLDGLGQLVSLRAVFDPFQLTLQYWDSHQFQSPEGDRLYHSVSRINPVLYNANYRKMLMARIAYEKDFGDQLSFLFRTQFAHDLKVQSQDVIMELYLRWKFKTSLNGSA